MPNGVLTATENKYPFGRDFTARREQRYGQISFAAGNYQKGGLPVNIPSQTSNPTPASLKMVSAQGSGFVYVNVTADLWPQNTVVVAGQSIVDKNGNLQTVTTGGTTNNVAEPTWNPAKGGVTADGGAVVWTNQGKVSGLVKILTGAAAQSPLTELTGNSGLPAGVLADVVNYEADFIKG